MAPTGVAAQRGLATRRDRVGHIGSLQFKSFHVLRREISIALALGGMAPVLILGAGSSPAAKTPLVATTRPNPALKDTNPLIRFTRCDKTTRQSDLTLRKFG